jgi:transcriptional regulator with XRE-family HTH domain
MKNQSVVSRLRERIKPEQKLFVRKNLAISEQISSILENKGWSQKRLAAEMGKKQSEISKLLSGMHNLTLQSIAKVEAVLGEEVITTPLEAKVKYKTFHFINKRSVSPSSKSICTEERLQFLESVNNHIKYLA